MSRLLCPSCKGANVQVVGGKTKTTLNLNPFHPFTLVNHTAKGKTSFQCTDCGKLFTKNI